MGSSEPTTPVRIPKAATTYTPTTQDPDLRSSINMELLRNGHINRIQETLLHTLNSSPKNWPTLIENHALSILRSGECHTFPELMSRVMEDIRHDTSIAQQAFLQSQSQTQSNGTISSSSNGEPAAGGNGVGKQKEKNGSSSSSERLKGSGEGGVNLALPKNVVDEGIRITRECLDSICEI